MRIYQCYGLNPEGDVVSADDLLCGGDGEAELRARAKLDDFPVVELWDAGRLVCRLSRPKALSSSDA